MEKARTILSDLDLMREKTLVQKLLEEIRKEEGGLAAYGEDQVRHALELGAVDTLLVSEGLRKLRLKLKCGNGDWEGERTVADEATLPGYLDQAKAYWSAQLGIPLSKLADIRIAVADLPGLELAMTVGRTIYIDRDGAGGGWTSAALLDMVKLEVGHILGR